MPSYRITVSPSKRAAGRFVYGVRRAIQKAFAEEQSKRGLTQTAIARALGIHRSVINRELRGKKDITLGRVAELAWAMGRKPHFDFLEPVERGGQNYDIAACVNADATSGTANIEIDDRASSDAS